MKKFIIFIVLVVFIGFAIHMTKSTPTTPTPIDQLPPITGTEQPAPTNKTFTGSGITFQYPSAMNVDESTDASWRNNTEVSGQLIAQVTIPDTVQPSTNFRDAVFRVGTSNNVQAMKECLTPTNGERAKGTVVINGVTFNKLTLTDAGAGNFYDTTSYRAIRNNQCYAVEYTIHSTNIGNYDPNQGIKEFDTQAMVGTLEDMVQSFAFVQ